MNKLENFISLLAGKFDNKEQYEAIKTQNSDYPFAMHVNTVCNEKIRNLPNDFKGIFLLEESYYFTKGMKNTSPHLFLFTEENSNIKLVSYKIPEGYDKKTFTYENFIGADYKSLEISEKFTPAIYTCKDGIWEGGSESMFTPVLKFILNEKFSEKGLEVSEIMEMNGRRTFGFDEPILYKRV